MPEIEWLDSTKPPPKMCGHCGAPLPPKLLAPGTRAVSPWQGSVLVWDGHEDVDHPGAIAMSHSVMPVAGAREFARMLDAAADLIDGGSYARRP